MLPFDFQAGWTFRNIHRLIKELKKILFEIALLVVFVVFLVKFVSLEIGW